MQRLINCNNNFTRYIIELANTNPRKVLNRHSGHSVDVKDVKKEPWNVFLRALYIAILEITYKALNLSIQVSGDNQHKNICYLFSWEPAL